MEKPRKFIHYRTGMYNTYGPNTPGALVFGRVAIPVHVYFVSYGLAVAFSLLLAFILNGIFVNVALFLIPLSILVLGIIIWPMIGLVGLFRWMGEEIRKASA